MLPTLYFAYLALYPPVNVGAARHESKPVNGEEKHESEEKQDVKDTSSTSTVSRCEPMSHDSDVAKDS